jgi:cell division protein FtsI/penicillin-binding protein 2
LNDFRKEIKLIGALTLDQAYVIKQDHGLFINSQWIKCQDPYSILFRYQFRNDGSLLGALSYRSNPISAQIYKKDKKKKSLMKCVDEFKGLVC